MNRVFTCASYLIGVMVLSACSTIETPQQAQEGDASAQDPTRIQLNQPLHFSASDGSDVVAEAGTYQVDAADSRLTLSMEGRALLLLDAGATTHGEKIAAPLAVLVPGDDPEQRKGVGSRFLTQLRCCATRAHAPSSSPDRR